MAKFLVDYIKEFTSYSAKSIGSIISELYDRLSAPGYVLQRGDLEYQHIPEELYKNMEVSLLESLIAVDQLLIRLLKHYDLGANPNSIDPYIMFHRESYVQGLSARIQAVREAIEAKERDPKKHLHKLHRSLMKIDHADELDKSPLNTKYKNVMVFLKDFQDFLNGDQDYYVDLESKAKVYEMIDKLAELSEAQLEHRRKRLHEMREFFDSTKKPS